MLIARRLLLDGGPTAITLKAVATEAGMAHSNLTHHFGSAAGLQSALAEQMMRDLVAAVTTAIVQLRAGAGDRAAVVDMVFDAFDRGGAGRLIAWLASSGQEGRLEPLCAAFADLVTVLHGDEEGDRTITDHAITIAMVLLPALGASLIGGALNRALSLDQLSYRRVVSAQLEPPGR